MYACNQGDQARSFVLLGVTLTVHTATHGFNFQADDPDFTINVMSELSRSKPPLRPWHAIAVPMLGGAEGLRVVLNSSSKERNRKGILYE